MATAKTPAKKSKMSMMRKRSAKMTPAVRTLRYQVTNSSSAGTETSHYIDLAKDLSAVNRRLYRQGRDYHVKRITILSTNTIANGEPAVNAGRFSVSTTPNTWVAREAWKRGFKTWNDSNKIATSQTAGNVAGTWSDFKVHLSADSRTGTQLVPIDNGDNAVVGGEWAYTQLVTPDGTTGADGFFLTMLGNHVGAAGSRTSVGLIKSYGESRATVQNGSPNVPGDASADPLVNVFDYGTTIDDVVERLEFDNDFAPYDVDNYPGDDGNMPKPLVAAQTAIALGSATISGFTAIAGLLEIEVKSPISSDVYDILVELAPGKYRGIMAEVI